MDVHPTNNVSIGIDPYPYKRVQCFIHEAQASNVQVLFWLMASSASPSVKLHRGSLRNRWQIGDDSSMISEESAIIRVRRTRLMFEGSL